MIQNDLFDIELLVLQGTPFCNINCRYCYLPNRTNRRQMPEQVVDQVCRRLCEYGRIAQRFEVLWHAGEPLISPLKYYLHAVDTIRRYQPLEHATYCIQTNGTLLTKEHCLLFKEHGFTVGVSLDGPPMIHDSQRITRSGAPTHDKVMRAIRLLQEYEVEHYVICVLTAKSLQCPDAIFQHFESLNIVDIRFNIEEIDGTNLSSSLSDSPGTRLLQNFYHQYLARARETNSPQRIRDIDDNVALLLSNIPRQAHPQTIPLRIVSVDTNGNFSTFSPELLTNSHARFSNFQFGNVYSDRIEDIWINECFVMVHNEIKRGVENCRDSCEYFRFCGGGQPSNKLFETGSFATTETMWCRLQKQAMINLVIREIHKGILM